MFRTSGRRDVSATSRAAKIDVISSPSRCTVGSGRQIARRWHLRISRRTAGASIHGHRLATRRSGSQTMPNTTSMAPTSHACPFWTTSTMTVSPGMMSRVTTRSRSYAKIPRNCWTTWLAPIAVYVFKSSRQLDTYSRSSISVIQHPPSLFLSSFPVAERVSRHVVSVKDTGNFHMVNVSSLILDDAHRGSSQIIS